MKKWILSVLVAALFFCSACNNQFVKESAFSRTGDKSDNSGSKKNISLVCWNLQTFFDATTTGTEYKEFKSSDRWNKEKYLNRLNKLCEVMTFLNPDVFVMEEIENEAVIQDIANVLAGGSWEHKKNWQYTCFAKESGSSIGCAVFSKYELTSLKVHSLDIRTQSEEQPSSRPLMQVTVCAGNKDFELFVNHWKSKSGGEDETEIWRDWQELVLAENTLKLNPDQAIVMCGDFNRSAEDFIVNLPQKKNSNTLLRGINSLMEAYSPWFEKDGKFTFDTGSYYYNGEWERIDNIFLAGNTLLVSFSTVSDSPLADEEGIPASYKIFTGEGCSDHLPLKCVISI